MLISVAPVDASLRKSVLALRFASAQFPEAGSIDAMLIAADASPSAESMAILDADTVVGYYRLEDRLQTITTRTFTRPGIALLGYCIDAAHQGRGKGARALSVACDDVRTRRPEATVLVLNVACNNLAATRMYRRGGFKAVGPPHPAGTGGPEQLMALHLKSSNSADPPDHD
ncbi:MAG: GNAT family N-acetyltransferase [Rhodanobacteraceae bacterium]